MILVAADEVQVAYENNLRLISNDLQHLKQVVLEARQLLEDKGGN